MREQVVAHKVGNRTGMAGQRRSAAVAQRPMRREGGSETVGTRLRALLSYVPTVLKLVLAIVIGVLIFAGYRAATAASFFLVRNVEVQGTNRVAATEVQAVVRKETEKTGVWNADLEGISARLRQMPWVRTAVVSRVLPDVIRVRISERVPRVVVRAASGRFRWVDEDAELLGEMLPTDQIPTFFLRGLNEEDSEAARKENRERIQKFMELERDWDAAGLSERVSEVNLNDLRDVRAQLAGDSSQVEIRLGSQDQGKRLKVALDVLDAQRQTPRGALISYIDISQGRRAIIGLVSGAHTMSDTAEVSPLNPGPGDEEPVPESTAASARTRQTGESSVTTGSRTRNERNKPRDREKKPGKSNSPTRRTQ